MWYRVEPGLFDVFQISSTNTHIILLTYRQMRKMGVKRDYARRFAADVMLESCEDIYSHFTHQFDFSQ